MDVIYTGLSEHSACSIVGDGDQTRRTSSEIKATESQNGKTLGDTNTGRESGRCLKVLYILSVVHVA